MNKQSIAAYLGWLKETDPALHFIVKKRLEMARGESALNGVGTIVANPQQTQQTTQNIWATIADTVKSVAPTLLQLPYQKKAMDLQMKRAEQGLPPLDMTQYSPTIKVAADISPETEASLTRIAVESSKGLGGDVVKKILPYAAGGLILWGVLRRKKR